MNMYLFYDDDGDDFHKIIFPFNVFVFFLRLISLKALSTPTLAISRLRKVSERLFARGFHRLGRIHKLTTTIK